MDNIQFDSLKWKENKEERYLMINDLIKNKKLIGKPKNEIIELMGDDFEIGPCDRCIGYSTFNPNQGYSIDHEVIEIMLDSNNRVNVVCLNFW